MKILHNLTKHAILVLVIALLLIQGIRWMAEDNQALAATQMTEATEEATDLRIADLEAQLERLSREKAALTAQMEQLTREKEELTEQVEEYRIREQEVCILVLRFEKLVLSGLFGDAIVVENAVQEVAVSRRLYDSCQNGEDITSMELHRLMTCDGLSDTRVIVESKYIRS